MMLSENFMKRWDSLQNLRWTCRDNATFRICCWYKAFETRKGLPRCCKSSIEIFYDNLSNIIKEWDYTILDSVITLAANRYRPAVRWSDNVCDIVTIEIRSCKRSSYPLNWVSCIYLLGRHNAQTTAPIGCCAVNHVLRLCSAGTTHRYVFKVRENFVPVVKLAGHLQRMLSIYIF